MSSDKVGAEVSQLLSRHLRRLRLVEAFLVLQALLVPLVLRGAVVWGMDPLKQGSRSEIVPGKFERILHRKATRTPDVASS